MANVHGVAEQSIISPNDCNGFSTMEQEVPGSKVFQCTDLLVYLGKQHGTRKRSKRHKNENTKAGSAECTNRFLGEDLNPDVDISPPKQVDGPCLEIDTSVDGDICYEIISHDLIISRYVALSIVKCDLDTFLLLFLSF